MTAWLCAQRGGDIMWCGQDVVGVIAVNKESSFFKSA